MSISVCERVCENIELNKYDKSYIICMIEADGKSKERDVCWCKKRAEKIEKASFICIFMTLEQVR